AKECSGWNRSGFVMPEERLAGSLADLRRSMFIAMRRSNALKVSCGPVHAQAQLPHVTNLIQALDSCPARPSASPFRYATRFKPATAGSEGPASREDYSVTD